MSNLDIQQVIIYDATSIGQYTKFVDVIKPPNNTSKCYITIDKFEGMLNIGAVAPPMHSLILEVSGIMNAYSIDANSSTIVPSRVIDVFSSSNFSAGLFSTYFATYSVINNKQNWIRIGVEDLHALKFEMKTFDYPTRSYVAIAPINFLFFALHLKIKFE